MNDTESEQLCLPISPQKDCLRNLPPRGIGTPLSEAMTSYLPRLSIDHCVTTAILLADVIFPAMSEAKLSIGLKRGSSRIFSRSTLFNGPNLFSQKFVSALQMLTSRSDILYLTFLPLKELIVYRGIFRTERAWCQECLETWRQGSMVIYEALIWLIRLVKVCPVHKSPLLSICPTCGRTLPIISRISRPGYCSFCGNWLAKRKYSLRDSSKDTLKKFDLWTATNLGDLIASFPDMHPIFSRSLFINNIARYIDIFHAGSASSLAKDLCIPRATVKRWRSGTSFPTLEHLLSISFVTQTPLIKLITKGIQDREACKQRMKYDAVLPLFPKISAAHPKLDHRKAKLYLQKILRDKMMPPPTMTQVARKIGYSKKTLYKYFPVLCRSISARSANFRKTQAEQRIRQENLFVERTAEQLYLKGIYPSYDAVERASNKKGILRGREARSAWRKKLSVLGLRDNTSLNSY